MELQWGIKTNKTDNHIEHFTVIIFFSFGQIIFLGDTGGARSNKKSSGSNVGGAGTCSGVFQLKLSPDYVSLNVSTSMSSIVSGVGNWGFLSNKLHP